MNSIPLGDLPLETFLSQYWQKKPLLIRNALPNFESPVSAEILAGLACEDGVESRLIIKNNESWQLQHGPFTDEIFSTLPESGWTLLVQAVDHYIPQAAELLEKFNFIPRWRIDDLMMSYASNGGGVGAHYDNYDVFLIQTGGQRQWQIGGIYNESSATNNELPVKILTDFQPTVSWTLNPGDILYLPPGIGHNGIALGDGCITCSVGFRAPSHSEILREYTDYIGDQLTESSRYQDPDLASQSNSGEISDQTLEKIEQILSQYLQNPEMISDWFGRYITTPKYQQLNDLEIHQSEHSYSQADLKNYFASNHYLVRNESSRFAFNLKEKHNHLYVDGVHIVTHANSNQLVELLCSNMKIYAEDFIHTHDNLSLLLNLLKRNSLYLME
ncbi:MAG: cupin domain-containing protein [Gammaproteobacteria bacterium]|nr:cupin domain-containing protein [Gammaproteobacteria bacterium]